MNNTSKWIAGIIVIVVILSAFTLFGRSTHVNGATSAESKDDMGGMMHSLSQPSKFVDLQVFVGKPASDFSLEDLQGNPVKLSDYKGKNVVLFFNEGAMCYPACWDQMAALAGDERFNNDQVATFSVVVDLKSEWQKITRQLPKLARAKILFDTSKEASSAYGVLNTRSSMHPGILPGHTYFVIDKEGIIRFVLDDPAMGINNDLLAAKIQ